MRVVDAIVQPRLPLSLACQELRSAGPGTRSAHTLPPTACTVIFVKHAARLWLMMRNTTKMIFIFMLRALKITHLLPHKRITIMAKRFRGLRSEIVSVFALKINHMTHLHHAHLSEPELQEIFLDIIWQTPVIRDALTRAQELALPNWRVVSGALYNVVWNHLTDRPAMYGVKDIDLFYFDPDISWEAEDTVIRNSTGFPAAPPVEIRNQARVHIWYEQHFGYAIPPYESVEQAIDAFACKTHCVGIRLGDDGQLDLYAPHGLRDIFTLTVRPNPARPNHKTHENKGKRALEYWPELTILPWPE